VTSMIRAVIHCLNCNKKSNSGFKVLVLPVWSKCSRFPSFYAYCVSTAAIARLICHCTFFASFFDFITGVTTSHDLALVLEGVIYFCYLVPRSLRECSGHRPRFLPPPFSQPGVLSVLGSCEHRGRAFFLSCSLLE
jgi:hypothetical protein